MGVLHIIEAKRGELTQVGNAAYPLLKASGANGFDDGTLTTSTSSASFTLADTTRFVTIVPTVGCHIEIGEGTVTATTSNFFVPANTLFSLEVTAGTSRKIAAIEPA